MTKAFTPREAPYSRRGEAERRKKRELTCVAEVGRTWCKLSGHFQLYAWSGNHGRTPLKGTDIVVVVTRPVQPNR